MPKVVRAFDAISKAIFIVAAAMIVFMAFAVAYEVVARYFLGSPTIWVTEVSSYLLVAVTFLGAAWTLRVNGHIRMDFLSEVGGPKGKFVSDLLTYLVAGVVSAVLLWTSWDMALSSFLFGWRSSSTLGTPLWIPQATIPLGAGILLLQSILGLLGTLFRGGDEVA